MSDGVSRRDALALSAASLGAIPGTDRVAASNGGPIVSIVDHGARGDGVADDSVAFQKALDSGVDVFVPATNAHYRLTRTLATTRNGQRIFGQGDKSRIVQTGSGANATVLAVVHDDCAVYDLQLSPGTRVDAMGEGWGVAVVGSARCTIAGCLVRGARRGGVILMDAHECAIRENRFLDSVVVADGRSTQADMGSDILMAGSASRNVAADNICASGCGTGIACQSVTEGKSQAGNVIRANVVKGHPCYGVMVYLSGSSGAISGVVIVDNTIDDISGTVSSLPEGTAFYGAGIYVQTADDFLIRGNRLRRTNSDRHLPRSGSDVPAAIAISGLGNGIVEGNLIRDCLDGITSIQSTRPIATGEGTVIANNNVSDCDRFGINLSDCAAAIVTGNQLTARGRTAAHGIYVLRTKAEPRLADFVVTANVIQGFHVGVGVEGAEISRALVSGNTVTDNRGYAIAIGAVVSIIANNIVRGEQGIYIAGTARHGLCSGNVIGARGLAIIDDTGSGVTVRDNVLPLGAKVSAGLAMRSVGENKRWLALPAHSALSDLGEGYEGEERIVLAEGPVRLADGSLVLRNRASRTLATDELASFVFLAGRWREVS